MAAILFDNGQPTIICDDGRVEVVPAEVVAQADEQLDIIEICRRYAIKAGLVRVRAQPALHAAA